MTVIIHSYGHFVSISNAKLQLLKNLKLSSFKHTTSDFVTNN